MKANIGFADKTVRLLIAAVIAVLYFTNTITGTWAIILSIFAIVLVLTSFISFCPLYMPLRINTLKKHKKQAL